MAGQTPEGPGTCQLRHLPRLVESSGHKAMFEHSDVYNGLPILHGHFSFEEKKSISFIRTPGV